MSAPRIAIRPATLDDAVAIARVRVEAWRTTYRGVIPQAYLDAMSVESSALLWEKVLAAGAGKASVFVVHDDDGIVGFSAGNLLAEPKHGYDSELTAIYLRPAFQRAGLGRRLVVEVAQANRGLGARGMIVWVLAENKSARAFYEALGAVQVIEQPFEWDGIPLVEAGYGWPDLAALVATDDARALH